MAKRRAIKNSPILSDVRGKQMARLSRHPDVTSKADSL